MWQSEPGNRIAQYGCPPRWRRRSAPCTLAQSYKQRLPILIWGRIPLAFQLPKVRRLIGNLASSCLSSMKPVSPDGLPFNSLVIPFSCTSKWAGGIGPTPRQSFWRLFIYLNSDSSRGESIGTRESAGVSNTSNFARVGGVHGKPPQEVCQKICRSQNAKGPPQRSILFATYVNTHPSYSEELQQIQGSLRMLMGVKPPGNPKLPATSSDKSSTVFL